MCGFCMGITKTRFYEKSNFTISPKNNTNMLPDKSQVP